MADLVLDWGLFGGSGTNLSGGGTVDTGGVNASISYTHENAGSSITTSDNTMYVAPGEDFEANSSLALYGTGGTGSLPDNTLTTTVDFSSTDSDYSDEVSNVNFRINDLDVGTSYDDHIDIVTIRAYDAAGNEVPVNISAPSSIDVNGNTATGDNAHFQPNDAQASIEVTIPGPVARIEFDYDNGETTDQIVYITNMNFSTNDADDSMGDYIVEGTDDRL
jgi:hypothetical protein